MNIDNLNKLIAHLEAQPPERINMSQSLIVDMGNPCGTCGCIIGHAHMLWPNIVRGGIDTQLAPAIGFPLNRIHELTRPSGWMREEKYRGGKSYPAHRVIATLKRLRDTYLSTGQVVVDWGPEPGEEPKQVWTAPQVAEVINPALPAELTSLLRNTVEV